MRKPPLHRRDAHGHRGAALGLILVLVAGCAGPGPAPFQAEVPGARSSTAWVAEAPPQLARPGEALTPEAILDLFVEHEIASLPGAEISRHLETAEDGLIGYLRVMLPPSEHPLRARDARVRIEETDAGWQITVLEYRYHCATEQPSTDFCQ